MYSAPSHKADFLTEYIQFPYSMHIFSKFYQILSILYALQQYEVIQWKSLLQVWI